MNKNKLMCKAAALIIATLAPLVMYSVGWAAIYYVDATNGNNSNNGLSMSSAWKTIAKVNASTFYPGDQILFNKGDTWREQLTVPSSGSSGNPITIGAYGSGALPVINGANLLSSGWTQFSSTVWQASVTTRPNQVFFDGIRGTPETSTSNLNAAKEWYWASNVLYVYSTSDPATAYTNPGVEVSQRTYNISENGKSYVTIQNLNLQNSNTYGLLLGGAASNIIIDGCTVGHSYIHGISSVGSAETQSVTIQNCTVNWNGSCGINVDTPSHHWTIQDNIVHNNSQVYIAGDGNFLYSGGIKGWAGNDSVKGIIIQRNKVYSQGKLPDNTRSSAAAQGIWPDTFVHTNYTDGILITRNEVYDNQGAGISLEIVSYSTVSYNLVYNNNATGDEWGIRVYDWYATTAPVRYNRIYNNVVYGNAYGGIHISGSYTEAANRCIGNEVKNNIVVGNGTSGGQLNAEYGGENDGTMGSGNVYLNNALGPEQYHFIGWGHATFKQTYAAWYAAYPAANGNTVQGDPLFVNASTSDFRLSPPSPAINAGTNVGLTSDYEGNHVPFGLAPDIGAYEYHSGFLKLQPPIGLKIVP